MKKLCRRAALFCVLCILLLSLPVYGDESAVPSLFAGDEAWYKDSISPLVLREEKLYIPAELCSMFDYIDVTTPRENNLLIHNTLTGQYISILFKNRSAAVSGEIVENVSLFRDSGTYYVDALLVAEAVGLQVETYTAEDGSTTLRLYDEQKLLSLEELIASYLPKDDPVLEGEAELPDEDTIPSFNGKLKRIYVLCRSPRNEYIPFPAIESCELYGINYTHFVDEDNGAEDVLRALAKGTYGVVSDQNPGDAEALDSLNSSLLPYSRQSIRYTLSTGDKEKDAILREQGYIPISPDFTVNGSSRPDTLLVDIINYIGTYGSCTLYLEDCWNSERMAILLSELENSLYCTANLAEYSFEDSPK